MNIVCWKSKVLYWVIECVFSANCTESIRVRAENALISCAKCWTKLKMSHCLFLGEIVVAQSVLPFPYVQKPIVCVKSAAVISCCLKANKSFQSWFIYVHTVEVLRSVLKVTRRNARDSQRGKKTCSRNINTTWKNYKISKKILRNLMKSL